MQLCAAAAISAPFDLARCAAQCDDRYGGVFARHFLRTLIPKALDKARRFPGVIDAAAVRRCRTFRAFDDLVTAPMHGFRDAGHYWRTQSCGPFVPRIAVPTLLVNAQDDPLVPAETLPAAADLPDCVQAWTPARGGHAAFVAGGSPWAPRRWAEGAVLQWLEERLRERSPASALTRVANSR